MESKGALLTVAIPLIAFKIWFAILLLMYAPTRDTHGVDRGHALDPDARLRLPDRGRASPLFAAAQGARQTRATPSRGIHGRARPTAQCSALWETVSRLEGGELIRARRQEERAEADHEDADDRHHHRRGDRDGPNLDLGSCRTAAASCPSVVTIAPSTTISRNGGIRNGRTLCWNGSGPSCNSAGSGARLRQPGERADDAADRAACQHAADRQRRPPSRRSRRSAASAAGRPPARCRPARRRWRPTRMPAAPKSSECSTAGRCSGSS